MRTYLRLLLPSLLLATVHCGGDEFSLDEGTAGAAGAPAGGTAGAAGTSAGASGADQAGAGGAGSAGSAGQSGSSGQSGAAGSGGQGGAGQGGAGQGGAGEGGTAGAAGAAGAAGDAGTAGVSAGGAAGSTAGAAGAAPGGGAGVSQGGAGTGGAGAAGVAGGGAGGVGGGGGQGGGAGLGGGGAGGAGMGGAGQSGNSGQGGGGMGGSGPVDCPILYVSLTGLVGNDGCSPDAPLPAVGQAIGRAGQMKPMPTEIRVCQGVYPESVTLDIPVSLEGNYSCSTWQRPLNTGTIVPASPPVSVLSAVGPAALRVTGKLVQATTHIRGFTLQAATPEKDTTALGLVIEQLATPSVEGNAILGPASLPDPVQPSIALRINAAGGIIAHNRIDGGKGKASNPNETASRGILVNGTGVPGTKIEENLINGGDGQQLNLTGGFGSVGLEIRNHVVEQGSLVVQRNVIRGGQGRAVEGFHGVGVTVSDSSQVRLLGNDIVGNTQGNQAPVTNPSTILGVQLLGASDCGVIGNRIYAGEPALAKNGGLTNLLGVTLDRCTNVVLDSNVIHGGNGENLSTSATTTGLQIRTATDSDGNVLPNKGILVQSNTVLSGLRGSAGLTSQTVQIAGPQDQLGLINNLLVAQEKTGQMDSQAVVLAFTDCYQDSVTTFRGNALVSGGDAQLLVASKSSTASMSQACLQYTDATAVGATALSIVKQNNSSGSIEIKETVVIKSACVGDSRCEAVSQCTSSDGCLARLFLTPAFASQTIPLFSDGFRLYSGTPCSVLNNGVGSSKQDLLFFTRTSPFSIGAYEFDQPGLCSLAPN